MKPSSEHEQLQNKSFEFAQSIWVCSIWVETHQAAKGSVG